MAEPTQPRARSRLPRFKSYEEEAAFWDTHDSTEFESEFKPTMVRFADKIQHVAMIPLERPVMDRLVLISRARGEPFTELAAQLIAEGLDRIDPATARPSGKKGKKNG
jgi:hypothetical protein